MQNLTLALILSLVVACGAPDTVNVSAPAAEETPATSAEEDPDAAPAENADKAKEPARRTVTGRYELVNANPANRLFISPNYCAGSNLRDCWVRSGYLTAYADGSYDVAIELWDTYEATPYTAESGRIDREEAFLLTDKAKLETDRAVGYKMLWAVVRPEDRLVTLVYDWAGDGPGLQGDDELDTFEFLMTSPKG